MRPSWRARKPCRSSFATSTTMPRFRADDLSVVFNQLTQQSTGVEFAGAALYTLPALLIYLYFQNDILEGVQLTELK